MDVAEQVARTIERYALISPDSAVVVGFSGGPDSLCLLHVLCQLRERYNLDLQAAHLHHGIRGEDADADAAFAQRMAAELDVPITIGHRDVPKLAARWKLSIEEAARRARYGYLIGVARRLGAWRIAVGHNADDQAESVLMHWLRGAGLAGLRGMLPLTPLRDLRLGPEGEAELGAANPGAANPGAVERPIALIRPLLEVPRAEIEAYCQRQGLAPRFDRSNLDTTYFRNRLRHELLPILEGYNPNFREVIRRSARVIADDYALLRQVGSDAWREVVACELAQAIAFDLAAWRALPISLQRATIREAIHRLRRSLRNINWVHVENAIEVARAKGTGQAATLPQGLELRIGYQRLWVADEGVAQSCEVQLEEVPALTMSYLPVRLPGTTPLPGTAWELVVEVVEREALPLGWESNADPWQAYLDADAAGDELALRARQPGDRFQPLGMGGHEKPLREWLINAKVPVAYRDRLPILSSSRHILWIGGGQIDERAKIVPGTRRALCVAFRPMEKAGLS